MTSVSRADNCSQSVSKETDGTLTLTLDDGEKMEGFDQVLLATGRQPVLDKLDLDNAGVKTERGYISVRQPVNRPRTCNTTRKTYDLSCVFLSVHSVKIANCGSCTE